MDSTQLEDMIKQLKNNIIGPEKGKDKYAEKVKKMDKGLFSKKAGDKVFISKKSKILTSNKPRLKKIKLKRTKLI
jgi:hypothetical protein